MVDKSRSPAAAAPDLGDLVYKNLGKFEFLIQNERQIERYLENIAGRLVERYSADISRVTTHEVWVITNCEAGITKTGKINPGFVHSLGQVGLYPLPEKITYWNGPDAPAWIGRPHSKRPHTITSCTWATSKTELLRLSKE
jgi:hypothetical protein